MAQETSKILEGSKYVYLVAFFALLSGVFYPLIYETSLDGVVMGVLVLFLGLAGTVLLYKSATADTKKPILMGIGFGLMGISAYLIFVLTGRV